jgi:hypothetical protein
MVQRNFCLAKMRVSSQCAVLQHFQKCVAQGKFQDTIDVTISKRKKKTSGAWPKTFISSCSNLRHRKMWLLSTMEIWKTELQRRGEMRRLQAKGTSSNLSQEKICDW